MKLQMLWVLLLGFWTSAAQDTPTTWKGALNVNGQSIELIFELTTAQDTTATLSVPAQGLLKYPATTAAISKDSVSLHFTPLGIKLYGTYTNDSIIKGTFYQNNLTLPLSLIKERTPFVFERPQTPKPPYPYIRKEAHFTNDQANIGLSGTLNLPKGTGPFPAVVLISGSGPQDRTTKIAGHAWYAVLADQLARKGIAVLHFDDRGTGASKGDFSTATTTDFALDAYAALKWLRMQPGVDPKRTGYLGHSEGGLAALIAANEPETPGFLILLATPVTPGHEFMLEQKRDIETAMGLPETAVTASNKLFSTLYTSIINMEEENPERKAAISRQLELLTGNALPKEQSQQLVNTLSTTWMATLLKQDPEKYITGLNIPVLALYGSKDLQVNAKTHSSLLKKLLPEHIRPYSQVSTMQALNHLFQPAESGLPEEYAKIETSLSLDIVHFIEKWLAKR